MNPRRRRIGLQLLLGAIGFGLLAWTAPDRDGDGAERKPAPGFEPASYRSFRGGFPTLTMPPTVSAGEVTFLDDEEEVVGVVRNGQARAYPMYVLAHCHGVNDVLGDEPVFVAACVVCSSALALDPVVEGTRLTFGFDGVHRGMPVFFDHQSQSRWLHLDRRGVSGRYAGRVLRQLPGCRYTLWGEWRRAHSETDVVAPPPGLPSGYRRRGGGEFRGSSYVPNEMKATIRVSDRRMSAWALVYGIVSEGHARAYPLAALRAAGGVVHDTVHGQPVTVWLDPASESVVAFDPRLDGRRLEFEWRGDRLRDRETDSLWTLDGVCASGALEGRRLAPRRGIQAEWYGWSAAWPNTPVWPQPW